MRTFYLFFFFSILLNAQKEAFVFTFNQLEEQQQFRTNKKGKINATLPKKWVETSYQEGVYVLTVTKDYFSWEATQGSSKRIKPILYRDLKTQDCSGVRSVSDSYQCVSGFNWHIQKESVKVITYDTRKAIAKSGIPDNAEIVAWYAPFLKFPAGSNKVYGLPGVILKLQITQGEKRTTYTAENITTVFLE